MDLSFLIDVPPPNARPIAGGASVTVSLLIVLALAAALIAGFVFLVFRIKRRRRLANELATDVRPSTNNSPE